LGDALGDAAGDALNCKLCLLIHLKLAVSCICNIRSSPAVMYFYVMQSLYYITIGILIDCSNKYIY
jgi:hypothetical protein